MLPETLAEAKEIADDPWTWGAHVSATVSELLDHIKELETTLSGTQKALRAYAGHHSSCPKCFAVWREVAAVVNDPYTAEPNEVKSQ
jgi:hypothetical protein